MIYPGGIEMGKVIVVTSDACQIDKLIVTLVISVPVLFGLVICVMLKPVKKEIF